MEIIPILAFIVLVATVMTFVFAFAAYIMFKIRESRGKMAAAQPPQSFQGEYVTPDSEEKTEHGSEHSEVAEEENSGKQPRYLRYTSKGYLPVNSTKKGGNN